MYNPYDPYGYLFPGQRMASPPMYQPMGTGMPQAQQTPQGDAPVVLQVATVKQVEQATVQPGSKALVLVANEPVIAMRSADNMGLTTTDYYHIEKFDPEAGSSPSAAEFVTRAEFQQFVNSLRSSGAGQHQPVKEVEK